MKYPFGMTGPFEGLALRDPKTQEVLLDYKPNPKQYLLHNCCADEVLFGGATFGGKTWALILHILMHCLTYGKNANTVILRRTYDELIQTVIAEFKRHFDGRLGTYKLSDYVFEWNNGAKTWFRHMETRDDIQKRQGANYTIIAFDELTRFEEDMYTTLFAWGRAGYGEDIPCQMLSGTNPGGIGHRWVHERFIKGKTPMEMQNIEIPPLFIGGVKIPGRIITRMFIPAFATDNTVGQARNPDYLPKLAASMSPAHFKALAEGDWDFFEGMAFPEWDRQIHIVKSFPIPQEWKVLRGLDWGYKQPYYTGWAAQDPETKAIYLIDEIYGAVRGPNGGIKGVEQSPEEVRGQICSHETANAQHGIYPPPRYGVADPSMWQTRGGEVGVGDLINKNGILFEAANRDRNLRAQIFHALLRVNPETGKPGLMVFENCKGFWGTFPQLQMDERKPEDLDRTAEDHPYDAVGYILMEFAKSPAAKPMNAGQKRALRESSRLPVWV